MKGRHLTGVWKENLEKMTCDIVKLSHMRILCIDMLATILKYINSSILIIHPSTVKIMGGGHCAFFITL